VVTNATDNTISVYKGRGDGTFSAPHNYNVGKKPVDVIAADVDNNGTLDLIVVDQNDLNIAILKGNGDATFQPAKFNSTGAGSNPISVVAGDFGTGHIDLAVANNGSGNVAVLLNTGNGTYASPVMYPTGTGPSSITSGDFNGDGLADLAVTNNGSGNVSILLGSGGGAFQAHVDYPTGKGPWFVTTGHFNADSNLDLAIGSAISASNRVTILLGDGQGHFVGRTDHATSFLLGGQTAALAVADFNGDGADDIAMADQLANKVSVFLNSAVPVASPAFIAFGNQNVGIASTPVTVNFTNSGGAPLGNVSAATSGTDFSQADTCPQTLAPTDTCTAQVTFDPTDVGLRLGSLVFTDNAITGTQKVPLGGTGNGSGAQLSVPSLSFPVTLVGTTSITQKVTLTNYGNQTLNVSDVHVTGPFQQSNNCKPTVLPGKSCTISVAFKPTKGGDATGAVTITDDAFNSPQVISLSGVGTIVKVTPTAVTFGPQSVGTTSPPQPINVSNVGNVVLNVSSITITGQNAADFAETDNCTPTVAKQTSCTINVTFTPHGTGTRFATLNINDDGGASPQTVTLTGTGQ
jgi:hypothetical protein